MEHHVEYREQLSAALEALDLTTVSRIRELLARARGDGRQVFLCGNGGSAATASHMANDLGKGASCGQDKRFKVIALTDNLSWITALANDISYESIFSEQLRNLGGSEDLLIAISGSGNSQNVIIIESDLRVATFVVTTPHFTPRRSPCLHFTAASICMQETASSA